MFCLAHATSFAALATVIATLPTDVQWSAGDVDSIAALLATYIHCCADNVD
jgi:hypothetical protein